jgi:hypothetical protein
MTILYTYIFILNADSLFLFHCCGENEEMYIYFSKGIIDNLSVIIDEIIDHVYKRNIKNK